MDAAKLYDEVCQRDRYLNQEWREKVKDIPATYQGDRAADTPFNILFSNTETIVPALFSQAPTPSVRRRFGETRGDMPAQASERMLSFLMDTNIQDYPTFVESAESSVLDAALPGQGQVRVRLVGSLPVIDYVPWDKFTWGYARRWEDVPWYAYTHDLTADALKAKFDLSPEKMAKLGAVTRDEQEATPHKDGKTHSTYAVHEVWHKLERKVFYLCESYEGRLLHSEDPPIKLTGFFPSPAPLNFLRSTTDTKPRPLYHLYEQQAKELNTLTQRIQRVTKAIRVRGIYNGQLKELAQLFTSDSMENALIPAETPALLERGGTLEGQIWLIPIERLVIVLRELVQQREAVKATIYEILGIGDILRGVSRASETLGAQQIKDKWGSLRITKLRERTARFLRDTLRLTLEAAANHTPEPDWAAITALPILPSVQKSLLTEQGQKTPQPSWGEVLAILRDDMQRAYHIDIETNTTVDAEASDDKQQIAEFMTGLGQALQGLGPVAQQGPEGFQAVKAILIEFCKKFRIASDVLRILEQLQPPASQGGMPPEVQEQIQQAMEQIKQEQQAVQQERQQLDSMKSTAEKQLAAAQKTAHENTMVLKEIQLTIEKLKWQESVMEERVQLRAEQLAVGLDKKEATLTAKAGAIRSSNASKPSR